MIYKLPYRRLLILTEGHLGIFSSKTAVCVLRYRPSDVVGLLDSQQAGKPIETLLEGISGVPIFANVNESLSLRPDALLIGIAPVGGELPQPMRKHIIDALNQGLAVISGLHTLLGQDPAAMGRNKDINLRQMVDQESQAVTTRINVSSHLDASEQAARCHASQISGGYSQVPRLLRKWLLRFDRYARIVPPFEEKRIERDLFAGVIEDQAGPRT